MQTEITRRAGPFYGDGQTVEFPFSFYVFSTNDVLVVTTEIDHVEKTELLKDVDYTVKINGDQEATPGGSITLMNPLPADRALAVLSNLKYTQETQLTNFSRFPPEILNDALDRNVLLMQQLKERLDRTITVPATSKKTPDQLLVEILDIADDAGRYAVEVRQNRDAVAAMHAEVVTIGDRVNDQAEQAAVDALAIFEAAPIIAQQAEQVANDREEVAVLSDQVRQDALDAEAAANSAGYSLRYCAEATGGEFFSLSLLKPSTNVKPGDHVLNAAGDVFEITIITDDKFMTSDRVTSIKGADGPEGTGLEVRDTYADYGSFIADHPRGEPGDVYYVGTDLYVWSAKSGAWVNKGKVTVVAALDLMDPDPREYFLHIFNGGEPY